MREPMWKGLWRPLLGYSYIVTCLWDFTVAPIFFQVFQGAGVGLEWKPLTVEGGGLYHVAMGAVLGVSAWSRGTEKIEGMLASLREAVGSRPADGGQQETV